jgi:hypothetical protein
MPGLPVIMNETCCTAKPILEKYADQYLEVSPSKARMTVCTVPRQRRKVGT